MSSMSGLAVWLMHVARGLPLGSMSVGAGDRLQRLGSI